MVDDFNDEELAEFEALDDETRERIERFNKWTASKKPASPARSSANPPSRDLSLSELRDLMAEPSNRSILKSLLAEMETLGLAKPSVGGGVQKAGEWPAKKPRRFL